MHYKRTGNQIINVTAVALINSIPLLAQERPNIILIMTDQQTADAMSNRGNLNLQTPAMDALAADGVTFTRGYCSYPLSGPSRASIMTGKMPVELGITDNEEGFSDKDIRNTIGVKLSENGYECLYAGKWHIPTADIPQEGFGFQKLCGMNDLILVNSVRAGLQKKSLKPMFLVASFLNPHEICEYARSQSLHYGEVSIPQNAKLPDLPKNHKAGEDLSEGLLLHKQLVPKSYPTANYSKKDWQEYLYTYYRLIERVDHSIGELVSALKKADLYDNSLIIFTSDHGDGVAAHCWNQKRALFEEVINVPLIIKPPKNGGEPILKTSNSLVNIGLDIYPTICDYAGVKTNESLNGCSLQKIIQKEKKENHKGIFIETFLDGLKLRAWAVIEGDYKYVYYQYFKNKEQLFNLKTDKSEVHNLTSDKKHEAVRLRMREIMLNHAKKVNDKVLVKSLQ